VWFGTQGGIIKFDGTTWTTYNTSNSGLTGDIITSIAIDNAGNIWCAPYGPLKICKFDSSKWTVYNSGIGYSIRNIAVDKAGNIWFGSGGSGVIKYDGNTWILYNTANSGLANNSVRSITIDSNEIYGLVRWWC